jgi:hypothetical protein
MLYVKGIIHNLFEEIFPKVKILFIKKVFIVNKTTILCKISQFSSKYSRTKILLLAIFNNPRLKPGVIE